MKLWGRFFIAALLAVTTVLFFLAKTSPLPSTLVLVSQFTAVIGTTLLSISFITSARFRVIDRLFGGLDRVYRTHHVVSGIATMLLLHHPLLLVLDKLPNLKLALLYIVPSGYVPYLTGILSLWIMTLLVVLTLYVDLPYHVWKKTHEFMGVALLFATLHVYLIPSDVSRFLPLRVWMLTLLAAAAASYAYKLLLSRWLGPRWAYTVTSIRRVGDVVELTLSPEGPRMAFIPGQFAFLSFASEHPGKEEHPFSICSAPQDEQLRFCAKMLGDFTLKLRDVKPGDSVTVMGPFGAFGERFLSGKPAVCIAGGIGITPFVSMVANETRRPSNTRRVDVVHTVTAPDDAVAQEELSRYCWLCPTISYTLHPSADKGRLTAERVQTLIGDISNRLIFLCGPPPMMAALTEQFVKLGVRRKNIIAEDFSLK